MNIFDQFLEKVRRRSWADAYEAPNFAPTVVPEVPADDAAEAAPADVTGAAPGRRYDAAGLTFAIGYNNPAGHRSRRRVTVYAVEDRDGKVPVLHGRCHETKGVRSFALDRVDEVVDMDGTVHRPPDAFFERFLGVQVDRSAPAPDGSRPVTVSRRPTPAETAVRRACQHGVKVLAFLAHADGQMDTVEAAEILRYCRQRCRLLRIALSPADDGWLGDHIRRLRPDLASIERSVAALNAEADASHQRLILHAARLLMAADGETHPDELAFIEELEATLEG